MRAVLAGRGEDTEHGRLPPVTAQQRASKKPGRAGKQGLGADRAGQRTTPTRQQPRRAAPCLLP